MVKLRLLGCLIPGLFVVTLVDAQQIDIGLYPTAVPDSFEVRATSSGPAFDGMMGGAVFTIRWEASAGGEMDNSDVHRVCDGYSLFNYGGMLEIGGYRYFTLLAFGERPLGLSGCTITTEGRSLFGFRIRELSGCRHVELVQNAFTGLNNLDYYISVNGDVTGNIITDPISSGVCPPCEPPVITDAGAGPVPYCGLGVDLNVEATGTLPDYAWYRPNASLMSWLPQLYSPTGSAGFYTVVVSNACGADTAQVEAVVDPDLCIPPAIDSVWFNESSWGTTILNFQLHAAATGSCLEYEWTMPWGETLTPLGQLTYVNVANPTAGNYTLVVSNACGTDTLVLYMEPPNPCEGPVLSNAGVAVQDPCHTGQVVFDVTVSGPGPITTRWYSTNGLLITGSPHFTMPFMPWGLYTFVAANACRADTLTVFHGPADTTGLAACEPPRILSLTTTPVSCYGDTVNIIASTVLTGPCALLVWGNIEVLSTSGDTVRARLNTGDPVMLTATNACGQVVEEVPIEVVFPEQVDRSLCRVMEPLSLDSLLALYSFPYSGGQWKWEGMDHDGIYDPTVDTSGIYQYYLERNGVSCSVVDLGLHEFPGVNAGEDSSVTVCSSDPPFPLFGMLGGTPQTGGNWRYGSLPTSSTYDPAVSTPGTYTYRLMAMGGGGGCTDMAEVNVAVIPPSTWYVDTDEDGLGDPADTLQACAQPFGYVAVAGDECPEIPGTVGDACDDGNSETVNDVLTEECLCEGEPDTGIAERSPGHSTLWPNPNDGNSFYLLTPMDYGVTSLTIIDATGRNLLQKNVAASWAPIKVDLPADIALGTYIVSLVTDRGVENKRLVITR